VYKVGEYKKPHKSKSGGGIESASPPTAPRAPLVYCSPVIDGCHPERMSRYLSLSKRTNGKLSRRSRQWLWCGGWLSAEKSWLYCLRWIDSCYTQPSSVSPVCRYVSTTCAGRFIWGKRVRHLPQIAAWKSSTTLALYTAVGEKACLGLSTESRRHSWRDIEVSTSAFELQHRK